MSRTRTDSALSPHTPAGMLTEETDRSRFVYRVDGAPEGELVYRSSANVLTLLHTEVPEVLRGSGIGGRLVQAAVDRAAEHGEVVRPVCPFTRHWLDQHPEAADRITIDWG